MKGYKSFPSQKSQLCRYYGISIKPTVQKVLSIKHTAKDLFNTLPIKTDKYGFEICFFCTRSVVIMSSPWFYIKCWTLEPKSVRSGVEWVKLSACRNHLADIVNFYKRFYCVLWSSCLGACEKSVNLGIFMISVANIGLSVWENGEQQFLNVKVPSVFPQNPVKPDFITILASSRGSW